MPLAAIKADITKLRVDIIVNPTNPATRRGGGLCGIIYAAAGFPDDPIEPLGLQTGQCTLSKPGNLPCKAVIHAVGPIYDIYSRGIACRLLATTYRNIFATARANFGTGTTIAVPAISTGIYRFPPEDAAQVAVAQARHWMKLLEITLVAFDDKTLKLYQELI
jgi:O-acetyl-ADP-ribose deacetylase (regulator of RNase III)